MGKCLRIIQTRRLTVILPSQFEKKGVKRLLTLKYQFSGHVDQMLMDHLNSISSGGSREEAPGPPPYFETKLRPEGQKKFLGDRASLNSGSG